MDRIGLRGLSTAFDKSGGTEYFITCETPKIASPNGPHVKTVNIAVNRISNLNFISNLKSVLELRKDCAHSRKIRCSVQHMKKRNRYSMFYLLHTVHGQHYQGAVLSLWAKAEAVLRLVRVKITSAPYVKAVCFTSLE